MDPNEPRRVLPVSNDSFWENFHRRNDPDSPWYEVSFDFPEDVGDNEDTGDDIRRRERMAEAMYEV